MMTLSVMFGYDESYVRDDLAPEALLVWDEFCIDGNPEGYEEAVKKTQTEHPGMTFFVAEIAVDEKKLKSRMRSLRLQAEVLPEEVGRCPTY